MAFMAPVVGWVAANAGAISATASVIGTGMSAYGAYKQGQVAEAEAKYQAGVVRANAMQTQFDSRTNEQSNKAQSAALLAEGQRAAAQSRLKSRRAAARFTAQKARFGLKVGSVSFNDSLKSFNQINKQEELDINFNTAMQTRSLRHQSRVFGTQSSRALQLGAADSNMLIAAGKNRKKSGTMTAFGNLIGGAGKTAAYAQDWAIAEGWT